MHRIFLLCIAMAAATACGFIPEPDIEPATPTQITTTPSPQPLIDTLDQAEAVASPTIQARTDTALPMMETPAPIPTMTPFIPTRTPTSTPTATPTPLTLPTPYPILPAEWQTYENEAYGFSFSYPPTWTVEQRTGIAGEEQTLFLELQGEEVNLTIGAKPVTAEEVQISCTGTGAGDIFEDGPVSFFGRETPLIRLVYEGRLKTVYFDRPCGEIEVEHLVFFLGLYYKPEARYLDVDISPAVVDEVSQILATFQLLEE